MVIGFGNPGPRYAGNRHNVGAMVVQELASRGSVTLTTHKAAAERKELPFLLGDAADAVEMVLTHGLTAAQQKFHAPA